MKCTSCSCDFLFITSSTKSVRNATFHALGANYIFLNIFNGFQNSHMFYLNGNYNNCDKQTQPKIVFFSVSEINISKFI